MLRPVLFPAFLQDLSTQYRQSKLPVARHPYLSITPGVSSVSRGDETHHHHHMALGSSGNMVPEYAHDLSNTF
ncbi:hypothetical protein BJX62DRAFT_202597 [Aspergillus germanicus]